MPSDPDSRKLAAIMFTDIVGYSAISQKNEILALELLEIHRDIIRGILSKHRGKEIKTIGDAFLIEFDSALDAVQCGIEIQKAMEERNNASRSEERIYLRIGIHVGDVVHRDGDIYGDGVNISSRIEPLSKPGGLCISEDVERQVRNKIDVPVQKMEKRELKNIDLPVDTYHITLSDTNHHAPEELPVTENNRLAVLPFDNYSPDAETDYFSDGLTEELIMHLSHIKELKVVSRTTSMMYKNVKKDMHTIGKELNARYILEGSVRRHMDNLRITAQVIDVKTDTHLWANTFKGNMTDVFDIQETVAKEVVDAFRLTLTPAEEDALVKRSTTDTQAFDFYLHGRKFLFRKIKSYMLAAIDLFKKAVEIDPRYAAAYAGLGEAYAFLYEAFDRDEEWLNKAMDAALKALRYDPSSAEAYSALGVVYYNKKVYEEARAYLDKAIELDPSDFFSYWIKGRLFRALDKNEEATIEFEKVLELNPDFHSAYEDLRMTYEKLGNQEKRREIISQALSFYPGYIMRNPDDVRAIMFHAVMLQLNGEVEEAKSKMLRAVQLSPNECTMMYNAACFFAMQGENQLAVEHLQKAVSTGFELYDYIKKDPDFDAIREEPGYIELMKGK